MTEANDRWNKFITWAVRFNCARISARRDIEWIFRVRFNLHLHVKIFLLKIQYGLNTVSQYSPLLCQDFNLCIALIINCLFKVMVGKCVTPSQEKNGDLQEKSNPKLQDAVIILFVSRNSDYWIIRASPTIYLSLFMFVISMRNQFFTLLIEILQRMLNLKARHYFRYKKL